MTPSESNGPQYSRLAALSWLHFLNDGSANYLPGVLPAVLIGLHLNVSLAGAVMSALLISQALQLITGWLADHFGGRWLIFCGVVGTTVGGVLIGWSSSIWMLIPVLVVTGLASTLFHPQAIAGARGLGGNRAGLGLSIFLVGGEIGRGVWPLLASLLVVYLGLHWLWLLALPLAVSLPFLWRHVPVQRPRHAEAKPIDWRRHGPSLSVLVVFSALRALVIFGAATFLPVLWHVRGHSLVEGAALISVLLVVGIIGNVGGGHLADRIGRRPILFGSGLIGAALMAAFMLSTGVWQWILLGLLGMTLFATLPVTILVAQDLMPENRSLGSGIALGFSNGLAAVVLIPLGWLAAYAGSASVIWVLVGLLVLASIISLRVSDAGPRQAAH